MTTEPYDDELTQRVADALGIGTLVVPAEPGPRSSLPSWRMTTDRGRFLVKRLWAGADPDWWVERAAGMGLEQAAIEAGVRTAVPVVPPHPVFGSAVRVGAAGVFRAHEWLEHRPLRPDDDVIDWLGETVVRLHRLRPAPAPDPPTWWGLYDESVWLDWIDRAARLGRPWAVVLRRTLPALMLISTRLRAANLAADDHVLTHGDLEPYNVVITTAGPTLIDWDSVLPESATLELGRCAVAFGGEDVAGVRRVLEAYRSHGGVVAALGVDLLVRCVALDLGHLTERIEASLGTAPVPRWLDPADADERITRAITELPVRTDRLSQIARAVV